MRRFLGLVAVSGLLWARDPVREKNAMVVSVEPQATDVGVAILKSGGNAMDAAVAVAFALAVTYPSAGNLGGGGFLLYRDKTGQAAFFDFRERAPIKASRDMYLDSSGKPTRDSVAGWRSSGVPGTVKGLELAHQKHGRKKWKDVLRPAIRLAGKGSVLSYSIALSLRTSKNLAADPESAKIFQRNGSFYNPGDRLVQKDLEKTLKRIQKSGSPGFYQGETARILANEMARHGGLVSTEDLAGYRAIEREPLRGIYKNIEIFTAPPPSAGGVGILQMLGMVEDSGYEKGGRGSAATVHYLAEVMKRYYADRAQFLGDPDFINVPVSGLLSRSYIDSRRATIQPQHATQADLLGAGQPIPAESDETTHLSVVDSEGNAASLTYTLNGSFGNGITVPGLGFLLNNEMDDFSVKPGHPNMFGAVGGEANAIQPRKTPLSSMTPLIASRGGKLLMVIGAPGGTRITTGVFQAFLNAVDFKLNLQDAIDAPRLHHQWRPDKLYLESGFSPDTIALLKSWGHDVDSIRGVAVVEGIMVEENSMGRWLAGAYDGRLDGKAAGY